MQSRTAESQQIAEQSAPVVSGLAAIRHYIAMRSAMPLANLGDSVHRIHGGTEYDAELRFSDLVRAVNSHEALVKALENMIAIYWGDGDGELPEPVCIQEARAALASAREVQP